MHWSWCHLANIIVTWYNNYIELITKVYRAIYRRAFQICKTVKTLREHLHVYWRSAFMVLYTGRFFWQTVREFAFFLGCRKWRILGPSEWFHLLCTCTSTRIILSRRPFNTVLCSLGVPCLCLLCSSQSTIYQALLQKHRVKTYSVPRVPDRLWALNWHF